MIGCCAVAALGVALLGVSCTPADTTSTDRIIGSTPTSGAGTSTVIATNRTEMVKVTAISPAPSPTPIDVTAGADPTAFPPPQLPLLPASELNTGPLIRLRPGGRWLFGVREPSVLVRIDPATGEVTELDLGIGASRFGAPAYAYVDETVWLIGGPHRNELIAVDPSTMLERTRIPLDAAHGIAQDTSPDELWLTTLNAVRRVEIDTTTIGVLYPMPSDPTSIEAETDAAWVVLPGASQIARIDPVTTEVLLIATDPQPSDILIDGDVVWVGHGPTSSLTLFDRHSSARLGSVDLDVSAGSAVPVNVVALRPAPTGVWATVQYDGSPIVAVTLLIDRASMTVDAARTMATDMTTQTHRGVEYWVHRAQAGTIVRVDVANYDNAPATAPRASWHLRPARQPPNPPRRRRPTKPPSCPPSTNSSTH